MTSDVFLPFSVDLPFAFDRVKSRVRHYVEEGTAVALLSVSGSAAQQRAEKTLLRLEKVAGAVTEKLTAENMIEESSEKKKLPENNW